jgi:DNA primase catalytic core
MQSLVRGAVAHILFVLAVLPTRRTAVEGFFVGNIANNKRTPLSPLPTQNTRFFDDITVSNEATLQEKGKDVRVDRQQAGNNRSPASANSNSGAAATGGRWIGTDQLNHLKETVDIVDAIESYNLDQFSRKGPGRAMAVCPFHNDRNPSLSIDSQRRIYKCFSCGEGGDIFRFVSQMGALDGEDLTFYDSVRRVQQEFGDGSTPTRTARSSSAIPAQLTPEEAQRQRRLQERIWQANAAAAAFYSETLTTPRAGAARAHLSGRKVRPADTRTFALGYAPDAYFSGPASTLTWGTGSLVSHLQGLNFTADELVAAGLVIQTKRAEQRAVISTEELKDAAETERGDDSARAASFDSIMDRFRGRVIVPIFDSLGKRVLGFGGRILDETQQPGFAQPKYLNSPESLAFQKKNILFGHHLARETGNAEEIKDEPADVLLVEGYMDVISLYSVGVTGVVASMGTAVSSEQLLAAAQSASRRGGSLIVCLDSDEAGLAAVERLCSNGMLAEMLTKCSVDVKVCTLPTGYKDPGDFVEAKLEEGSSAEMVAAAFRASVVDTAVRWMDWYCQRILQSHSNQVEAGVDGSLRAIIDRLADFLATFTVKEERESKISELAMTLTDLVAQTTNSTNVSDTVRNQLESDLLQLASSKMMAKEAATRGGVDYNMDTGQADGKNRLVAALARGHGPTSTDDRDKLSSSKLSTLFPNDNELPATSRPSKRPGKEKNKEEEPKQSARSSFKVKRVRKSALKPDMIPHFSGFQFDHEDDAAWLGVTGRKGKPNLILGLPPKKGRFASKEALYPQSNDLVYFNSNDYHGHNFISDEAVRAGYSSIGIARDPSIAYKGVAFLVKPNAQKLHVSTEDEILSLLIRNGPARLAVKNWLDSRRAVNAEIDLQWSMKEKAWLFACLVDDMSSISLTVTEPDDLRSCMLGRSDVPLHALSAVNSTQPGVLDWYFEQAATGESPTGIQNGDAHAQELLATLVWASAADRAHRLKAGLDKTFSDLEQLPEAGPDENLNATASNNTSITQRKLLESQCIQLTQEYWEVQRSLQSLADSSQRVRTRILDETGKAAWGVQRLSKTAQRELAEKMDDFVLNYTPPPAPSVVESLMDPDDPLENEPYEEVLERIDDAWSNWLDDDGESSEPPRLAPILSDYHMDDDIEETVEEALARIDEEWKDWLD